MKSMNLLTILLVVIALSCKDEPAEKEQLGKMFLKP